MPVERGQGNAPFGSIAYFTDTGLLNSDSNFRWDGKVFSTAGPSGESAGMQWLEEYITLSTTALTTDSATILLPAYSLILAVAARIEVSIIGATVWRLGDSASSTRFIGAQTTVSAGSSFWGFNTMNGGVTTNANGPVQLVDAKVRIATDIIATAGAIRVAVLALAVSPPAR